MLRKATKQDASRLAEILIFAKRAAYRHIFKDDLTSFGRMQVLPLALSFEQDPSTLQGVLVWDDGIVKAMTRWAEPEGQSMELCELYVDPFFQEEGIGSAIIQAF